jgi:2-(1,2-epoxy-1,2-dihydrophenyl)acetyl-CoA isomerase
VADTAGFNLAFSNVALSCDTGASISLPLLVGRAKAIELLYFPRTVPAAEALELGLATTVVPADQVATEAGALAARLAAGPTRAYGAMRRSLTYAAGHDTDAALEFERQQMNSTGATEDHAAAVAAFVAKEKPAFRGR